jgi:hypothetical protein
VHTVNYYVILHYIHTTEKQKCFRKCCVVAGWGGKMLEEPHKSNVARRHEDIHFRINIKIVLNSFSRRTEFLSSFIIFSSFKEGKTRDLK